MDDPPLPVTGHGEAPKDPGKSSSGQFYTEKDFEGESRRFVCRAKSLPADILLLLKLCGLHHIDPASQCETKNGPMT